MHCPALKPIHGSRLSFSRLFFSGDMRRGALDGEHSFELECNNQNLSKLHTSTAICVERSNCSSIFDTRETKSRMGVFSITSETAFAHPPEVVFDFVSNPANWGRTYKGSGGVHQHLTLVCLSGVLAKPLTYRLFTAFEVWRHMD